LRVPHAMHPRLELARYGRLWWPIGLCCVDASHRRREGGLMKQHRRPDRL
jgi:hypothetical protein